MGWQPDAGHGPGGEPDPGASRAVSRDPRLAGFAEGGEWDTCAPGPELAAVLAGVGGPEWRCPGAEPDELIGVLRRLAALESWAGAARLAVIRELIRRDDFPVPGRPRHGDLPDEWSDSLDHELALALASSVSSAQATAMTAWQLGARLPGIAALLATGAITYGKAKLVAETFQWLSDQDAAKAGALLLAELAGPGLKTYGQLMNLTARIAAQVDPGLAERRRKAAVKHGARVLMFREQSGAAGLSGRELPTDETLAANASVCARAAQYKESGAFGEARMDSCRATAYLDLLNQVPADARIALGKLAGDDARPEAPGDPGAGGGPGGFPGPGGGPAVPPLPPTVGPRPPRPADLVIPLATLLGLAERPGEGHGLGTLDPGLCRDLASAAIASPRTQLCVTVTDPDGIAIGHGCGRPAPTSQKRQNDTACQAPRSQPPLAHLPARLNLTITTTLLAWLAEISARADGPGPRAPGGWALTRTRDTSPSRSGDPEPPGSYGTWSLTLPGGGALTVRLEPVPTFSCDHRYESHGYQPGDKLRHFVQVRDYTCTNPVCSRHARDTDFEHALPYHKGGRTCACNAGARSRKCHRIKQSTGWNVTQPWPGWHQWATPSGRTYTQTPNRYPI